MKIFDFNIHLPSNLNYKDVDDMIIDESEITIDKLINSYEKNIERCKDSPEAANFMIFNTDLFLDKDVNLFINIVKRDLRNSYITTLINFRNKKVIDYIDKSVEQGIDGIKFHSYVQRIEESDFLDILKICRYAEEKRLFICIDTSYGTSRMFVYDNLRLAAFISESIKRAPIILLHSGGARVIQAMLLAEDKKNIYLETSLSIPYLLGSSLENDFAFAYKKIGSERVLYASDFPFITFKESIDIVYKFLEKYKFNQAEIENIVFNNAIRIKNNG